jgi:Tol biopolymer transport system component
MKPRRRHVLLGTTVALALSAIGFAGSAQANSLLPGLNGKIAFTSTQDFPFVIDAPLRGFPQSCQAETNNGSCSLEIYSMNPDGSAPTRLTNNTAGDDEAAWLPNDGANIAFESDRATSGSGCNPKGVETCTWDIWSMANDGSNPIQLTSDPGDEGHASYSPDGSRIAFSGMNPDVQSAAADRLILISGASEIFTMPAGGESVAAPTALLPSDQTGLIGPSTEVLDSFPTYSPDGTKIAFTRETIAETFAPPPSGADSRLGGPITSFTLDIRTYVAPSGGGGPATPVETYPLCTVTENTLSVEGGARALANAVSSSDPAAVRSVLQSRLKIPGCDYDLKPAWSPDGSKLAVWRISSTAAPAPPAPIRGGFASVDFGDIAVFNSSDGSGDTNLSDLSEPSDCGQGIKGGTPCGEDTSPAWSPDGTKIVFDSDRQADGTASTECSDPTTGQPNGTCDFEIWTMNANGSGLTQLTNNAFDDTDPDWQRIPPPPPSVTPAAPVVPPKVGVAGVRRACVSSSFHVRFRISTTASTVKSVVVKLDGKRIKSTTKGSFTLTINGKKLKSGRHRLTITATDSAGHVTTTHKSFSVCKAAKPRRKTAPRFTG